MFKQTGCGVTTRRLGAEFQLQKTSRCLARWWSLSLHALDSWKALTWGDWMQNRRRVKAWIMMMAYWALVSTWLLWRSLSAAISSELLEPLAFCVHPCWSMATYVSCCLVGGRAWQGLGLVCSICQVSKSKSLRIWAHLLGFSGAAHPPSSNREASGHRPAGDQETKFSRWCLYSLALRQAKRRLTRSSSSSSSCWESFCWSSRSLKQPRALIIINVSAGESMPYGHCYPAHNIW